MDNPQPQPTSPQQQPIQHESPPGPSQYSDLSTPTVNTTQSTIGKNCKNPSVRALRQKIIAIGLPKDINVQANFHSVNKSKPGNKTAIKCRFYPVSELRKLLTQPVVKSILDHDCPEYCDQQRQSKEGPLEPPFQGQERRMSNKSPELSAQWAEKIVRGSLLTIFGLLVTIKRPLLIIDFFKGDIHDGSFPEICDWVTEDNVVQFWPKFHEREPAASRKAASVFMKQMWSFIPPHVIQQIDGESSALTIRVFKPQRILPIVSYKHLAKGGYGTVYAVKIHKDYCHPPAEFEAETYALKQIVPEPDALSDREIEIEKEIQTLIKIQSYPHANIIRFLGVYKHISFNMNPARSAYNFLMPLMQENLKDHFAREAAYGFRTIVEGDLYKQLIGIVGAIHHMIYTIKAHRLDLKPDNILLKTVWDISARRERHILVLADFGQARIERSGRMTTAGNSVTFNKIMTDAYAPPEGFRDGDAWVPRNMCPPVVPEKWDIWPLAGIFVEVLTFMALGCVGIKHLERHRHESYDDYRFWVTEEQELESSVPGEPIYGIVPVLKDTINKWLDILWDADFERFEHFKLEASETEMQDQCKSFLQWNIELVGRMFQPSPSDRPTINEILQHMEEKLLNPEPFFPSIKSSTDLYKLLGIQKPDFDGDAEASISGLPSPVATVSGEPSDKLSPGASWPSRSRRVSTNTTKSKTRVVSFVQNEELESTPVLSTHSAQLQQRAQRQPQESQGGHDFVSEPDTAIEGSHYRQPIGLGVMDEAGTDISQYLSNHAVSGLTPDTNEQELLQLQDIGYFMYGKAGKGNILLCHAPAGLGFDFVIHTRSNNPAEDNQKLNIIQDKTEIIPFHMLSPTSIQSYRRSISHTMSEPKGSEYILQFNGLASGIPAGTGIHTSNETSMGVLFETLTQQKILATFDLKSMTLRHEKRGVKKLFHALPNYIYQASRIEIWTELDPYVQAAKSPNINDHEFKGSPLTRTNSGNSSQTGSTRSHGYSSTRSRGSGRSFAFLPVTRRIAIYCNTGIIDPQHGPDAIFSIRYDGGIFPERSDEPGHNPNVVRLCRRKAVPGTHKHQISAYTISRGSPPGPGIPMSPKILSAQEEANVVTCSAVEFEFKSRDEAREFRIACLKEYHNFANELKAAEDVEAHGYY